MSDEPEKRGSGEIMEDTGICVTHQLDKDLNKPFHRSSESLKASRGFHWISSRFIYWLCFILLNYWIYVCITEFLLSPVKGLSLPWQSTGPSPTQCWSKLGTSPFFFIFSYTHIHTLTYIHTITDTQVICVSSRFYTGYKRVKHCNVKIKVNSRILVLQSPQPLCHQNFHQLSISIYLDGQFSCYLDLWHLMSLELFHPISHSLLMYFHTKDHFLPKKKNYSSSCKDNNCFTLLHRFRGLDFV